MLKDEITDYARIAGVSVLSAIKFGAVGIATNWLYGVIKTGWYVQLFEAGGWWIALAVLMILMLFAGIPALFIYLGYQTAIGKALGKIFAKNKNYITEMLGKVARNKISRGLAGQGGAVAAGTGELRLVRFAVKLTGYSEEWEQLATINPNSSDEEKEAVAQAVITKIITTLPEKIAGGLVQNLRTAVLVNLGFIVTIEVVSRFYP